MKITIALDWTPNVIHSGLLYALTKNIFKEKGLEVNYISTEIDNYQRKPIDRLIDNEADICIGPTEHLLLLAVAKNLPIQAVATVMQQDMSAFVVQAESGIKSPKDLDGKTYLGYQTPLEQDVLKAMIQNDGGEGTFTVNTPPRLDIWEAFLNKQADVSWVFLPWEAAIAKTRNVGLKVFQPHQFGVPYGYSTLLMARTDISEEKKEAISLFLEALAEGYKMASQSPDEVAELLCKNIQHPNFKNEELIKIAMQTIAPSLLNEKGEWGKMESQRFEKYIDWLQSKKLLGELPQPLENIFINEYL